MNLLDSAALDWRRVLGHRQVTDLYLLALTVRHGGRLLTFDRRIAVESVAGAETKHLVTLDG